MNNKKILNVYILEQHAIGQRWIDIVNFIESNMKQQKEKFNFDIGHYYTVVSKLSKYLYVKHSLPKDKSEVKYIYENWTAGKITETELDYLKMWEVRSLKLGYNLYRFLNPDMQRGIKWGARNEILWALYFHFNFFDEYFKSRSIDIVLGWVPENLVNYACYIVAKYYGATVKFLELSRIWPRIYFFDNIMYNKEGIKNEFMALQSRDLNVEEKSTANKLLTILLESDRPHYISVLLKEQKRQSIVKISYLKKMARRFHIPAEYFNQPYYPDETLYKLIFERFKKIAHNIRVYFANNKATVTTTDNYFYFPLHFQPEISTSFMAPYFNDQLSVINNISLSLPVGTYLLVKDHPAMQDSRPINYYKTIQNISNVILVPSNTNSRYLIQNSLGVITISGTAGLEAMILGRPAIVMSKTWFADIPGLSLYVNNFEDLPKIMHSMISFKTDNDLIEKFLFASSSYVINNLGLFQSSSVSSEEYKTNYSKIATVILDEIAQCKFT